MKTVKALMPCLILLMILPSCTAVREAVGPGTGAAEVPEDMVLVREGRFVMGNDQGKMNERPAHRVILEGFLIDKYEVSAGQFADFLNTGGNPEEIYFSPDSYSTITALQKRVLTGQDRGKEVTYYLPREGLEKFPANNVSWHGAFAYCREQGKRLPTEAEWEKAARGGDKRLYPWGDRPDPDRSRYNQPWEKKKFNVMVPVDALPKGVSVYGSFNMAGNVWEWTGDWYRHNMLDFCNPHYEGDMETIFDLAPPEGKFEISIAEKSPQVPPRLDPTGVSLGNFKVLRGGSWYDRFGETTTRSTYRFWLKPDDRFLNTGFRCASSIQ